MIPIAITDDRTTLRWWQRLRRRSFRLHLPEHWNDVQPDAHRRRWWRWAMTLPPEAAQRAMVRDLLPRWVRLRISALDFAALAHLLSWTKAEADCDVVPVPSFQHKYVTYHFPKPKGENLVCIEFPLADEYYQQFLDDNANERALMCLLATLAREQNYDTEAVLRQGDARIALHSREEVEARADRLRGVPGEYCLQALLWFAGMKGYVHRVYGPWLFEQEDEEEEDAPSGSPEGGENAGSPNFGWWGIYQGVAESGVFGTISQVHQAAFHDVCVYLVRKRVEAEAMRSTSPPGPLSQREGEYNDE